MPHAVSSRPPKVRLDQLLVNLGLAETRTRAQALILAGGVRVNGEPATKAGHTVAEDVQVTVAAPEPFVGRGGKKLAAALDAFGVDPAGRHCLDAGASTGGFTDCLLQRGAARVIAVDVGYGQLDSRIATDLRVVVMDRTNVRHLGPDQLPPPLPDLIVGDLSFISLTVVLPTLCGLLASTAGSEMVLLVKPQFEVGPRHVGKGGIVREPAQRERAVAEVSVAAEAMGLVCTGRIESPITGAKGNVEFLIHLQRATEKPA
ncbi:MAG: TlyA family RNA methyltransferase [Nitrospirota bacterium]|nr:TlyA family RNA methyltransferase [Nitrospirota bacterium]